MAYFSCACSPNITRYLQTESLPLEESGVLPARSGLLTDNLPECFVLHNSNLTSFFFVIYY